jgi:hypothetical protein
MKFTNEQLYAVIVMMGRHLLNVEALLHETIALQHGIGKVLAVKLPDMTAEERQHMQDIHMRAETVLEHLQADAKKFRESFEMFAKAGGDDVA